MFTMFFNNLNLKELEVVINSNYLNLEISILEKHSLRLALRASHSSIHFFNYPIGDDVFVGKSILINEEEAIVVTC